MRVDPKTTVAGHPVLVVRRALRKLRQINTWDSAMLETAAGLPAGAGPELAKALAAEGLIRKVQRDAWTICQSGMTFAAATAANRLTRATADRALAAFMERVARVNSDPYFLGQVTRVALFGSMLKLDTDRPSDVDLAVQIVPKVADWNRHEEKNNERAQQLMMLGHRFHHTIEYAACWHLEVFRFLKSRSRAISLADYSIEKRIVLAVPHRMLLGDDESAPTSSAAAKLPPLRRPRGCPF